MERRSANRSLLRAGFSLILLGILTGLAAAWPAQPRLGTTAMLAGVLGGGLLVLLGLAWRHLHVAVGSGTILEWLARVAAYGTWVTAVLAGLWGMATPPILSYPLSSPGSWREWMCGILGVGSAVATLATFLFVVVVIRPGARRPAIPG